jgi:hypothetical protein
MRRIDIQGAQLAVVRQVRVAGRRCGGKPEDGAPFDGQDGPRLANVACREIISLSAIFGPKLFEKIVRDEVAVGDLPRTYVHPSYRERIAGFGWTELHVLSIGSPEKDKLKHHSA